MAYAIPELPDYAYPDFVETDKDKERWRLALDIAQSISADNEPSGKPDLEFVFYMSREVYFSDIPTGKPEDATTPTAEQAGGLEEALVEGRVAAYLEEADVDDILDELERLRTDDDASPEEHYAHVGRCCDVLDALFGNPDDIDISDDEIKILPPGYGLTKLEETWELAESAAFAGVTKLPYKASLHPRDRLGKWTQKLHGIRSFAAKHHTELKSKIAGTVAAARLHHEVRRSTRKGGALHAPAELAHERGDVELGQRLKAHAAEQRARQGLRGARQQAQLHSRRAKGHALYALGYVYSEDFAHKVAHKTGVNPEALISDQTAAYDAIENAKYTRELAHEVAKYAVEHKEEILGVLRVVKHAATMMMADTTEEDEQVAELVLAGVLDDV